MSKDDSSESRKCLRVLELYSGIGGMHFALKDTGIPFKVIQAYEINPLVLATYAHNFPENVASARNIESLTSKEINNLNIDAIVMSPPCQPFCRTGRKLDIQDTRSSSLAKLLTVLPEVNFQFLLLENVKGFETSDAREMLLETMQKCDMAWQEFLLTPTSVGVPNSRLRYYLLAKKKNLEWCFKPSDELCTTVPMWDSVEDSPYVSSVDNHNFIWKNYRSEVQKRSKSNQDISSNSNREEGWCVGDVLENLEDVTPYKIPPALISKYGTAMDIVYMSSSNTNCFTKGYGNYIKGTGSYLSQNKNSDDGSSCVSVGTGTDTEDMALNLNSLNLRYFTPREVARLMCYPEDFKFPAKQSIKQQYRALGNSINVYIVSILMSLLFSDTVKKST